MRRGGGSPEGSRRFSDFSFQFREFGSEISNASGAESSSLKANGLKTEN
jgi:hypothetical protein